MKKSNLEKCKSSNKGITLIALVITIIVLLILAGVTIAQLTGSDSAPAKANEAKQKNAIGAMKDEISIFAQNKQMEAYDDVYVGNGATAGGAQAAVGRYVINALKNEYKSPNDVKRGVTISISQTGTEDAEIVLTTTDWKQEGTIAYDGGTLNWKVLEDNNGTQQQGSGNPPAGGESTVSALAQSGAIQRWDKITGYSASGSISIADLPDGASLSGTINASDATDWVVLDVDTTTGKVLIMPQTVSTNKLILDGVDGFNNAIEAIEDVASIYLNTSYATSVRSLNLNDIFKVDGDGEGYSRYAGETSFDSRFSMNPTTFIITDTGAGNTSRQTFTSTTSNGKWMSDYAIGTSDALGNIPVDFNAHSFAGMSSFWLPDRAIALYSGMCMFSVMDAGPGGWTSEINLVEAGTDEVSQYGERTHMIGEEVIPVVTLKSNVQLEMGTPVYTETATDSATVQNPTEEEKTDLFEHNTWSIK